MAAKKKADSNDPNHVVVEVRVNQDPAYKTIDRRNDSSWETRMERDWGLSKSRRDFAACEIRGGLDFDLARQSDIDSIFNGPGDVTKALESARKWFKGSYFVREVVKLKTALFNYGFEIYPTAPNGEKVSKSDQAKFDRWFEENEEKVDRFLSETWPDVFTMSNAVAFWRKKSNIPKADARIITLPPELCKYSDAMGIEKLEVKLGWSANDFQLDSKPLLSASDIALYGKGGYHKILESRGEYFRVYKEDRVGWGFAWPSIQTLTHVFSQAESIEIADRLWAMVSRLAERRHKIGHEIKQGPRAGLPIHFIKKERATDTLKFYQGRTGGIVDTVNNFDQEIEFPFPSTDRFEKEKYASQWERMALWAGPVGHYLHSLHTGKGSLPFLLEMMQAEAEETRKNIRHYLLYVIRDALRPPVKINISWSNKIFRDKRQLFEAIKFLVTAGGLSLKTALREFDFCEVEERQNKQEEADLAADESTKGQVFPLYDPAHGDPSENSGGRPAGQKDGGPRVELNGKPE